MKKKIFGCCIPVGIGNKHCFLPGKISEACIGTESFLVFDHGARPAELREVGKEPAAGRPDDGLDSG